MTVRAITTALDRQYGLRRITMIPLHLGHDALTWLYRLEPKEGGDLLLKVRKSQGFTAASLLIPAFLHSRGLQHIIPPQPTIGGNLWIEVADYRLALFPFVEGAVGATVKLTARQYQALGSFMHSVHKAQLPTDLLRLVRREPYMPTGRHLIPTIESAVAARTFGNDAERAMAAYWNEQRDTIATLARRADLLGGRLLQASLPVVLCHGDMHPWNLLVNGLGDWWLVDWDEIILAPKERDLMFVIGGIGGDGISSEKTDAFLQGYANRAVKRTALAYYRYAWAVQDIAAYGEKVFLAADLTEQERWSAVVGFKKLFAPEHIVELALQSPAGNPGANPSLVA